MRKSMGKTPMSELLQKLTRSCFADRDALDVARTQAALWIVYFQHQWQGWGKQPEAAKLNASAN